MWSSSVSRKPSPSWRSCVAISRPLSLGGGSRITLTSRTFRTGIGKRRAVFSAPFAAPAGVTSQKRNISSASSDRTLDEGKESNVRHAATIDSRRNAEHDLRRGYHRRRFRRHVYALSAASTRPYGASLRTRRRRRRDLVLESVSGRALRHGKHDLLLLLFQRSRAGMGMDRTLRHSAG